MWHNMAAAMAAAVALAIIPLMVLASGSSQGADVVGGQQMTEASSFGESDETAASKGEIQVLAGERRAFCSRTAERLLEACRHEVRDDFLVEVAKCINLTGEEEREDCFAEAEEAREEARALCREQFESRDDVCDLLGEARYDPEIDPDDFLSPEEAAGNPNRYFPLVPGTVWRYEGGDEEIEVTVTDETIEILGVECFVVKDVVRQGGEVIEDTDDWYAMDEEGNVWYFGELTIEFEDGVIASLEGSWMAGVDGAKPGIIMKASPEVGDAYRQEFLLGEVEDLAEVISITGDESVKAASCDGHCVVTREFTPIEPGNESNKHYALDSGLILESFPDGDREELVEFTPGSAALARSKSANARSDHSASTNLQVHGPSIGNPLQSASVIRFELQRESAVSADVYDSTGRMVRALLSGQRPAGSHTVEWDGTDANHRRAAAGIYFVRLVAGNESASRKVVLVH
jgi:hypothetical protein